MAEKRVSVRLAAVGGRQVRAELPPRFVTNLLEVRLAMAPAYARQAADENPAPVLELLAARPLDTAEAYADYDWQLHVTLATASNNPVFTLILNGFGALYQVLAVPYFDAPAARGWCCPSRVHPAAGGVPGRPGCRRGHPH